MAVSSVNDFAEGSFQPVIDDTFVDPKKVKTLVFVTGKFYYDLLEERNKLERADVALVRLEQLFPLATHEINKLLILSKCR